MPYYDDYDSDDEDFIEEEDDIITFACEECDYRWTPEEVEEEEEEFNFDELICPMCGSSNVIEI